MDAYRHVRANKGAPGIDGETIDEFEKNLDKNLYKIWNRMSSGSYQPPPVKTVEIPKADGKIRRLGLPTVGDRVAQTIVKMYIEPSIEPHFCHDSYGYRPGKSGIQAIGAARKRCWQYNWVVDLDIKGFFDNIDHELMMRAVKKHTQEPWILLYIERWLQAPIQDLDGSISPKRALGTPQGGVISPLLANLFLHYAVDVWLKKNFRLNPFERYADDIIVHCKSEDEAVMLKEQIKIRLAECKLELHPEKTKIVYCKDSNRKNSNQLEKFDFLGYTFRPRSSRNHKNQVFINFTPAISDKAKKYIRDETKKKFKEIKSNRTFAELAKEMNPAITGWINYFAKYYASELWGIMMYIETKILQWLKKKYKKLHSWKSGIGWLENIKKRQPNLFKHWQWMKRNDWSRRAV